MSTGRLLSATGLASTTSLLSHLDLCRHLPYFRQLNSCRHVKTNLKLLLALMDQEWIWLLTIRHLKDQERKCLGVVVGRRRGGESLSLHTQESLMARHLFVDSAIQWCDDAILSVLIPKCAARE